jgi:hypothetical protein
MPAWKIWDMLLGADPEIKLMNARPRASARQLDGAGSAAVDGVAAATHAGAF